MSVIRELATTRHLPISATRNVLDRAAVIEDLRNTASPDLSEQERFVQEVVFNHTAIAQLEPTDKPSATRIANAYVDSLNEVHSRYEASNSFFEALAESQIDQRGAVGSPKWAEAVSKMRNALLSRVDYKLSLAPSTLSADIAALEPEMMLLALRQDIEERAATLARHFFETLAKAARKALVGHIHWIGRDSCRYMYFTAPIICEGTSRNREVSQTTVKVTSTTTFQHRFGIHVHDVMEAKLLHGMPSSVLMPARVERFAQKIPLMVRPLLAVVDGLLINEQVVEWDAFKTEFTEERIEHRPEVSVDPAIVIGPYALIGWSERDFDEPKISNRLVRRAARV